MLQNKIKTLVLLIGDLIIFYIALLAAILIRHGWPFDQAVFQQCLFPFSLIFLIWIILFSISHLYELRYAINRRKFFEMVFKLFAVGAVIAVIYFYLFVPLFAPKKVLFFTILFSLFLFLIWRTFFNRLIQAPRIKVCIVSESKEAEEIKVFFKKHPQLGYQIDQVFSPQQTEEKMDEIIKETKEKDIDVLVIDSTIFNKLFSLFAKHPDIYYKIKIVNLIHFYETVTQKIPISFLDSSWFVENYYSKNWELYETLKRIIDLFGGIILFILTLPLWLIISLLIKLDSSGPILHKSIRGGLKGNEFYIYKFRTMVDKADSIGPAWTLENDPRITRIGKILRFLHFDEIPQTLNIIKGDISFVGPRPEEIKLLKLFKEEIPFYQFRSLVKPGVIGWAQLNYPHGSSVEDAKEKLKYDFYYLKNRNIFFDFIIALKAWRIPFEVPTH
jgi:exopolysaccharide biosynthesis polyprenyl glycosylphosphotransferase